MSDTGWVSPGTAVNDDSVGISAWSNPENVKVVDNNTAVFHIDNMGETFVKTVKLVINGSVVGNNKSNGEETPTDEDTIFTYGSSSDLWGNTITASDVNSSNFGVVVQATDVIWGDSNYLKATNFGFNIPSGATIDGVEVAVSMGVTTGESAAIYHIRIKVYYTESGTPTVGVKYPLPAFKRP